MTADVTHFHCTRGLPTGMAKTPMGSTTIKEPNTSVKTSQTHALSQTLSPKATGQNGKEIHVNKVDLMIA